jgi:hypothetical protein
MTVIVIAIIFYVAIAAGFFMSLPSGPKEEKDEEHLWTSAMGGQQFAKGCDGQLRWCHRCLEWIGDPQSKCSGSKSATCHGSRG